MSKTRFYRTLQFQYIICLVAAIAVVTALTAYAAFSSARLAIDKNAMMAGRQSFDMAQRGFNAYIQTINDTTDITGTWKENGVYGEVREYIKKMELLNTGFVLLTDSRGSILVNDSRNSYVLTTVAGLSCWKSISAISDNDSGQVFTYDENIDGESVHIMASRVESTGWILLGFVSEHETEPLIFTVCMYVLAGICCAALLCIIAAVILFWIIRKEINDVNLEFSKLAAGNPAHKMKAVRFAEFSGIRRSYNAISEYIFELIKNVEARQSHSVSESERIGRDDDNKSEIVNQVAGKIGEVAEGAKNQALLSRDTTSDAESLAGRICDTRDYMCDVDKMSAKIQKLSGQGLMIAQELMIKDDESRSNTAISKKTVNEIAEYITKVKSISDMTTNLIEQTSILSRNASVEAAKVGENGRAFGVMSSEIRKLAGQIQNAIYQIVEVLYEIMDKSAIVAKTVDKNAEIAQENSESVIIANDLFVNIAESVGAIKNGVDSISRQIAEHAGDTAGIIKKFNESAQHLDEISKVLEKEKRKLLA